MKLGRVTAIIPCYNSAAFLATAITSALAQDYADVEVVVVNDGSTDHFESVIEPFRNRIRLIEQPNRGLSAARNRGIDDSDGEYIAYLDADDAWLPSKISRQVAWLQEHPECSLSHTDTQYVDADGAAVVRPPHLPPASGDCWRSLATSHNTIIVSSVLHRRSTLGDDRFDTTLTACEDWDMWLRLTLRGPVHLIEDCLTLYRVHGSNMSKQMVRMATNGLRVLTRARQVALDHATQRGIEARMRQLTRALADALYEEHRYTEARAHYRAVWKELPAAQVVRMLVALLPARVARAGRTGITELRRALEPAADH